MANFIGVDLYGQQTIGVQDTAARIELPNKADKDLYNVDPADVFSKIPVDTTVDSSATNSKLPTTKAAYDAIKAVADNVSALDTDKAEKDLSNVDKDDVWTKADVSTSNISSSSSHDTIPTSKAVFDGVIENCINDYSFAIRGGKNIYATSSNRTDLNTYVTTGNFRPANSGTTTTYIDNQPITVDADKKDFRLWVLFGEHGSLSIHQVLLYDDENIFYIRTSNDVGSTWTTWINYANVQPDWSQTDTTADDYIQNKPDALTASQIISLSGSVKYMVSPTALRNGIMGVSNPFKTSPVTLISAGQNEINSKSIKRLWKVVTLSSTIAPNGTADFHLSELETATTIFEIAVIGRDSTEGEQAPLRITKIGMANSADDGDIFITNTSDITVNSVLVYVDYSE